MKEIENFEPYKVMASRANFQIEEKKSKFIASAAFIQNEKEAALFMDEVKKKYWDARHHCYAYIIGNVNKTIRFSDDGEPTGTAGKPILEILLSEEICNGIIVVTRYFGGTLLGTGGLVRAYSKAAKEVLLSSGIARMRYMAVISAEADYSYIGKLQNLFEKQGIVIQKIEYTEIAKFVIQIPIEKAEMLKKEIVEITNARVVFQEVKRGFYIDKQ